MSLSHSKSFAQIALQRWATYKLADRRCGNSGTRKSEVADMIDEESDWISIDAAVALVETMLRCHREKAVELLRQAVDNLKVKSRTVNSLAWIETEMDGAEVFFSNRGKSLEVCRKDVAEYCLELQQRAASRSSPPKRRSATRNNVTSAIADLWPDGEITFRAKDRNGKIHDWLKSRNLIGKHEDVTRTIQRVLREQRNSHK